jgi:FixJ family two-component response regulator
MRNGHGCSGTSVNTTNLFVCVVDDDERALKAMAELVQAFGFSVRQYSSARAFLECEGDEGVHCVIADLCMPGMSGIELHDELRRRGHIVPFILITGYPDNGKRADAAAAGITCFLRKPVDPDTLFAVIRGAV